MNTIQGSAAFSGEWISIFLVVHRIVVSCESMTLSFLEIKYDLSCV